MTSTEFAARYRLLKNVATRGARSFLAQQVELGRMVMVHYLDSEKPQERAATLARLEALRPPARGKLLEIADVDGSPVAVTLFLSSFVDFATWLDSVSPDQPAPPPLPPPAIAPPPRPASDFTGIFGKIEEGPPSGAFSDSRRARAKEDDTPTLMMEPVKVQRGSEPAAPPAPSPKPAPAPIESGFTAIFGRLNETSLPAASVPNAWTEPVAPPSSISPPSMSPQPLAPQPLAPLPQPTLDNAPPKPMAPPVAYNEPAQPGEFTQLFQRMSPAAGSNGPSPFSASPMPFRAPEMPRPIDTTPAADLPRTPFSDSYRSPAPLPIPSLGMTPPASPPPLSADLGTPPSLGAAPSFGLPPVPNFSSAPHAPNANGIPAAPAAHPPAWGASALPPALGSSLDVGIQSEFTRILGRVAVPPPPPPPMAPPQGGPAGASKAPSKSVMPLIVALNAVVLLTIAIVAYFMLRKH
jgi:hypothetical protein